MKRSLTKKQINHIHYAKIAVQNVEAKAIKNEDKQDLPDWKKRVFRVKAGNKNVKSKEEAVNFNLDEHDI